MCDTLVAVPPATAGGSVWFAKNSDREPGEAQVVEHLPGKNYDPGSRLRVTHIEVSQSRETYETVISRPFWMWGAEMGANEHGVAIGNEAVFTRLPYARTGLTGMDLLRLALERARTARAALGVITGLIKEYGQGGPCGYRNKRFRYHNSFIIADPVEAWVLETAGPHWAAERVRGIRTISNGLSIGREFDMLSPDAYSFARQQRWCRSANDFDFAGCFGDPLYTRLSGGRERRNRTTARLGGDDGELALSHFASALRDHAGLQPEDGWRMVMPCAHSSWLPTRRAGQTTGSMISRLQPAGSIHWLTGTSSPCLSVFKPFVLGRGHISTGPESGAGFGSGSLFWGHEFIHRLALRSYGDAKEAFDAERAALESAAMKTSFTAESTQMEALWESHLRSIPGWVSAVEKAIGKRRRAGLFQKYWDDQNRLDRIPAHWPAKSRASAG
jgi:dipeptidase